MKPIHIHVGIECLDKSKKIDSAFFGAPPVKTETDCARWMLDDVQLFSNSNVTGEGVRCATSEKTTGCFS